MKGGIFSYGLVVAAALFFSAPPAATAKPVAAPSTKKDHAKNSPVPHFSVLINEFLPDPEPSVGLPSASFIELKNVSSASLSLQGWRISNGKTAALIRDEIIVAPDSLVAFCPTTAAGDYGGYSHVIGLARFPALGHVSGQVILTGPEDEVIDAIAYDRDSFNDPVKAEGGWSLERIDATKPCLGKSNWTASTDPKGGTPGEKNSEKAGGSTAGHATEYSAAFIRSFCPDSMHIMLLLDGPVDTGPAKDPSHYQPDPADIGVVDAEALSPFFDRILLTMNKPVGKNQIYRIGLSGFSSCGIAISDAVLRSGLPDAADSGDLVFNEILFNPPAFGSDYLELYHSGKRIIDLQNCRLASRDPTGQIKDPKPISPIPWLLFPQDYLVVTENKAWVQSHYLVKSPEQMLELSQLPSMPDDKGIVVLLNSAGMPVDELPYDHQWHSPLIADESGIALEKIGTALPSASGSSWTSAASTAGYGTPTYPNSESAAAGYDSGRSMVSIEPVIFSPDNDGYNDFCFVTLKPGVAGFTANISVYDASGINIKALVSGATLGAQGRFRWDGFDDSGHALASGRYLIFTEIFSLNGTVRRFKNLVVLAKNRRG